MSKITLLSEDLINKIAAGEVIERPASVVKELLENSLDAGATHITIEIQDSGKKLIRIIDNGEGMDREDAEKSILRHATSKLQQEEDLYAINTLGFRGEALASIAAVSHLAILTKRREMSEGVKLEIEGGVIINYSPVGIDQGTTIEVRDLFFNTPARKKFLKTDAVELRTIIDIVLRYALINPHIAMKLTHENHTLIHSPAVDDLRNNIASIYGVSLAKNLLEISSQDNNIHITGFVAKPTEARNDKQQQAIFVNGRWVKNEEITHAVYDAFHAMLFVNKHPIFVLNINVDPSVIDVNVHPAKTQVKFEQKDVVYEAVKKAISETLRRNNLIPLVDVEFEQQLSLGIPEQFHTPAKNRTGSNTTPKYAFEQSTQAVFQVHETTPALGEDILSVPEENEVLPEDTILYAPESEIAIPETAKFPPLKLLGQIHKTFFVAETPGGMFLIDQHAAHERVMYEQLLEQYLTKEIARQTLLQGEILECTPSERLALIEHKNTLENFGFTLELFGDNTFIVKTIPTVLGRIQPQEIIFEILNQLQEGRNRIKEVQETIITRMACRAAVMAGDVLTISQMESILHELARKKDPYTCPHGRPVMIKTDILELEKKFKRKG